MPMQPPTFNGLPMFGTATIVQAAQINPVEYQQTAYAGLNGYEELPLGDRGAWTFVSGRLYGATPQLLAAAIAVFRVARGWGYCLFVDSYGVVWPFVRLETFQEAKEPVRYDPGGLGYSKRYEARFFHAVIPS
jgi:hypothetical protein